jgi:hypothetical protein
MRTALAAAVLAALLVAAPNAAAKTFNGRYRAEITNARYTDNNTGGDSVGDQLSFTLAVKQNKKKHAKRLGNGKGVCTRIENKSWDCTSDITWIGGHVLLAWKMPDGIRVMRLKVTGGTKLYAGASGEITLTRLIKNNPMYWRADVKIVL